MTDRTVVYRIQADVSQAKAQVAALSASVKKAAGEMTSADAEGQKWRKGLDTLGSSAGKVGLVAAAGLGAAVLKAADFDAAMSKVSAATGETSENMDKLRQAALDAGAQTVFSATEAADGIEQLAKAGVSTEAILSGGLTGALDLAAAGEMAVGDAAEVAAKAMAQFGLDGAQVPHIADLLASAAGNASGEVSDFGMALSQAGLVANQVGLSLEETTGGLAAFAEAGLLGSDAGTSMKSMLGALTPNSKQAATTMEYLGLSAYDAQGNFVGLAEYAGRLRTALQGMTDEQRQSTMETIFGSDAVRAASVLYEQGADGMQKWIATVDDQGAAAEMAAKRLDNLKGDLEALGGAFETALIGTGDGSQGALRSLTQGLTDVVNSYNELGEGAKKGVGITLAATAGLGGGLFVFSRMVQSVAATREAMEALGLTSQKTQALVGTAAKGMGVALAAGLAVAAGDLFDVDYSLDQINRQLELLAAQGDAQGVLEGLSMSADTLGEALRDAAFNDFNMFGMGAASEIEELDAALAGLDPTAAAETFKVLIEEGTKAGLTVDEVKDLFPQYAAELKLAAKEAEAGVGSTDALSDANNGLTRSVFKSEQQLKAEADALKAAREAATSTAEQFFSVGNAVEAADGSVDKFIKSLEEQADALVNVRQNAKLAAENGIRKGLIEELENLGPAGAVILEKLAKGTETQIGRANAAFRKGEDAKASYVNYKVPSTRLDVDPTALQKKIDAAKGLLDYLGKMKPSPKVDAQTAAAEAKLNNLLALLREAERDRSSTVTTVFRQIGKNTMGPREGYADGGVREEHTAQIAPAGAWRIWAEPETGGEAYIPLAPSKRERSIDIWEEVGERLGVQFQRFAAGSSGGKTDDKKKPKRKFNGEQTEWMEGPGAAALEQAAMQASEAAEMYYAEQERAQRRAEQLADEQAAHQAAVEEEMRAHNDAILEGYERAWAEATEDAKERVDLAKEEVKAVEASMDRIGQAATAAFSGSWFTGEQQRGMWAGGSGTGDWRSKAESDISGLTERAAIISQLSGLGLSGAALEDLLGNQSNAGIQAMIGAGEIDDFAALFAQRASLDVMVQQKAGVAGYGSDMAAANSHLAQMNSQFAALTAAIEAARPITILQQTTEQAAAMELARILSMSGSV